MLVWVCVAHLSICLGNTYSFKARRGLQRQFYDDRSLLVGTESDFALYMFVSASHKIWIFGKCQSVPPRYGSWRGICLGAMLVSTYSLTSCCNGQRRVWLYSVLVSTESVMRFCNKNCLNTTYQLPFYFPPFLISDITLFKSACWGWAPCSVSQCGVFQHIYADSALCFTG